MPAFVTLGRIMFALPFVYLGAAKLFGIQAAADLITVKITIPEALAPFTTQLETATGMTTPKLLAISGGAFEVIAGLMVAVNFGARFFAILLILYLAAATFYFDDFWNKTPPDDRTALADVLKNVSMIGALFMIVGFTPSPQVQGTAEPKFITPQSY